MPAYTRDAIVLAIIAEGRRSRSGQGQLDHPVMSEKGIRIAIATGIVETGLKMYANNGDPESLKYPHDAISRDANSSGVFQQRHPWWGTAADRMDVERSAAMFYGSLAKQRIGKQDYNTDATTPGLWAQMVQRSAYPNRYDQHWAEASLLFERLKGGSAPAPSTQIGWTGDPIWLADVLRAEGVKVVELDGWRNRGQGDFADIWGVMCHHTGGNNSPVSEIAFHPTLGLASQIHLAKDGTATLCGVGVAYHSGRGSYPGLPTNNANNRLIGIEAVNLPPKGQPHRTSWAPAQYEAYVRICAAIIRRLGYRADRVIGHKEWAGVAQGKWDPGSIDMDLFRADVQRQIDSKQQGVDDMAQVPQEQWDRVYRELTQKYPSRSIYRTPGEGAIDTAVGFSLNVDAMAHQELVERLAITYGDPDAVKRIFLVANREGADPNDQAAIEHAKAVISRIPEDFRDNWKQA